MKTMLNKTTQHKNAQHLPNNRREYRPDQLKNDIRLRFPKNTPSSDALQLNRMTDLRGNFSNQNPDIPLKSGLINQSTGKK